MKNLGPRGFTLVELLVVIAIMALLALTLGPALQALSGAGSVTKAIADLSGSYDYARTFAMANSTYVRVALGQVNANAGTAVPVTVVLTIYPADGSLASDTSTDMADGTKWPQLNKPLILSNFCIYDSLNAANPNTASDSIPSGTNIQPFTRTLPGLGVVSFTGIVQFNRAGEAGVYETVPSRYIKIALDQPRVPSIPAVARNINPFILRLSGIDGTINILRKENL